MNSYEIKEFIENRPWERTAHRLARMEKLLYVLGDPHKKLKYVHVAGTNGKGSCCAMLTSILCHAGYRVATFTSPHLVEYNERFCMNGIPLGDDKLGEAIEEIRKACTKIDFVPTVFETLTAIAFVCFAREKADIVVFEVGLGGRLDATNVIEESEVSAIMNIGLEHTEILGDTLEKIAYEKAGIIKENGRVVAYPGTREVIDVFKEVAGKRHAELKVVDPSKIRILKEGLDGQLFDYGRYRNIELSLLGHHQFYNAAVVIETVKLLRKRGYRISAQDIRYGLGNTRWDARLSVLSERPLFILDGAHNPQCAMALKRSLMKILKGKKAVMLCGMLKDKDYVSILNEVEGYASEFVCLTPDSVRALPAEDLAVFLKEKGHKAITVSDIDEGIRTALDKAGEDGAVVAFGSLYLAGAIKEHFPKVFHDH
ncbi:MAG: bifunctional folylpolyglutamate synthase/dihydrofolate synthase [Erysipelotrichaceae bacterium]|nr:bifunctional folylpolyglutamate synthase/dihydrofolate synthase [Erysipelotrichaceae bacterium]